MTHRAQDTVSPEDINPEGRQLRPTTLEWRVWEHVLDLHFISSGCVTIVPCQDPISPRSLEEEHSFLFQDQKGSSAVLQCKSPDVEELLPALVDQIS
jgi:hypothetical protein